MRKTLLALLLLATAAAAQGQVQLRDGFPQQYTVVSGDTLWDISGKYLREPWQWPQLWRANPQIENPNLIYPGDTLTLSYVNGQPQLTLKRGESRGTIKLSPRIRTSPVAEAIPSIPLKSINSFLLSNRIVDKVEDFDKAPYIVAGDAERVLSGTGDRIFARGHFDPNQPVYGIFRQGKVYTDPQTKEFLGSTPTISVAVKSSPPKATSPPSPCNAPLRKCVWATACSAAKSARSIRPSCPAPRAPTSMD